MPRLLPTVCVAGLVLAGCVSPVEKVEAAFPECREHKQMLKELARVHGEVSVGFGLLSSGVVLQVLAHPNGKTFTVILTDTKARSCIVFIGEGWRRQLPQEPEQPT